MIYVSTRLVSSAEYSLSLKVIDEWDMSIKIAEYSNFELDKNNNYALQVSGYSSNSMWWLDDDLSEYNNVPFSTFDRDNNPFATPINCANVRRSAGW